MLKIICTFMALFITLAIFCSNNVESRVVHGNSEGIPASQLHFLRIGTDQIKGEGSNEDDREAFIHSKRKSEILASLYGLPYNLVYGKRTSD